MYYLIIALSLVMAGELEVEGNLNVTGDINSPTIDALSGMKPERIYRYVNSGGDPFSFTVPEGKIWYVHIMRGRLKFVWIIILSVVMGLVKDLYQKKYMVK